MANNNDVALGLPKGSVRAILAFALVGATVYMRATGLEAGEVVGTLAAAVVGYYFGKGGSDSTERVVNVYLPEEDLEE